MNQKVPPKRPKFVPAHCKEMFVLLVM